MDFAQARRNMVDGQLRPNRITNPRLLEAVGALPRERFLPDSLKAIAYADDDVPLGNGRVLMEPMVLARLVQYLQPDEGSRALVVASGLGYGAALLSRLVKSVVAIEGDQAMRDVSERAFRDLGIDNVRLVAGTPEEGVPDGAPYDAILIEGAIQQIPQAVVDQLAEGGRLTTVLAGPQGRLGVGQLTVKAGGVTSHRPLFDCGTPLLPGFAPPPRFTF